MPRHELEPIGAALAAGVDRTAPPPGRFLAKAVRWAKAIDDAATRRDCILAAPAAP